MTTVKAEVSAAIDTHTKGHAAYRDARYRVALGEMWGVFDPDEVDRLELALANVYEMLHDQSETLARLSVLVEFGSEDA